jgi:hypothetical protein
MNWGITDGYLFKLSTTNSETWTINGGDTVTIPKGTWVHVTADADTDTGIVSVKITNGDKVLYNNENLAMKDKGTLQGFYILGGRYSSITCVDNVAIKTTASTESVSNDSGTTESNTNSTTETTTTATSSASDSSSSNTSDVTTTITIGKGNGNSSSTSGSTANLTYDYNASNGYCVVTGASSATGSVEIPSTVDYNGQTYTVIGIEEGAFRSSTLTSITLPNTITYIADAAFRYCNSLTSITLPESVTAIGKYAFADCESLTTVTIKASTANIDTEAFSGCTALTTVYATGTAKTGMEGQLGLSTSLTNEKLNYTVIDNSSN